MHEMGLATSLVDCVLEATRGRGAVRIQEVEVEIGVLQRVVPEALSLAFAAASAGTLAAGAALKLIAVKAVAECRPCGSSFEPEWDDYLCPRCHQADVRVIRGNDVVLKSIVCEVEAGAPVP